VDTIREKTQNMTKSDIKEDYPLKYLIDTYKNPLPNIRYSNTTTQ
jgi:hypothetical protein